MTATPRVLALLEPVVAGAGYDLEDLTVSAAGKRSVVRVLVDKDGGVTLDDVADVSRLVSEALDAADEQDPTLLGTSYVLEVSSPGVDRPLTEPRHWRRNVGRLVVAALRDGVDRRGPHHGRRRRGRDARRRRACLPWAEVPAAPCRSSSTRRGRPGRRPGDDTDDRTRRTTREDRHDRPARPGAGEGDLLRPGRQRHRDGAADRLPPHRGRAAARPRRARPHAAARSPCWRRSSAEDGSVLREYDDTPEGFGRIAASTAKQVILQRLREAESAQSYGEYAGREGDIVSGTVQQAPQRPGAPPNRNVHVLIGSGDNALEAVLPADRAGAGGGLRPRHPPQVPGRVRRPRPAQRHRHGLAHPPRPRARPVRARGARDRRRLGRDRRARPRGRPPHQDRRALDGRRAERQGRLHRTGRLRACGP